MNPYEVVGVFFNLASVYLTVKENIWCWLTGIIGTIAFAILFYQIKLYADVGLQFFFIVTGFHGWYLWLHGGRDKTELAISTLTMPQTVGIGIGLVGCIYIIGYFFQTYTDAHIPFWDAAASGTSVLAQILLMAKKLETWYLWIVVNILSIGIFVYKEVYLTACLYVIFLGLATNGLITWQQSLRRTQDQPVAAVEYTTHSDL